MRAIRGTAQRRREILSKHLEGFTPREIHEITGHYYSLCKKVVSDYLLEKDREAAAMRQYPPTYQPDLNPSPFYAHHSEYSRHWAGAEKEDDRAKHKRGKDWPPKFV